MSKQPMIFYPYNYCLNCKTNSIEIYSWHNYGQHYSKLLDEYKLTGQLPISMNKYGIYTMRCSKCGKEYKIVWDDGLLKPDIDQFNNTLFMNKFREDSLAGMPHIIDNIYEKRMSE